MLREKSARFIRDGLRTAVSTSLLLILDVISDAAGAYRYFTCYSSTSAIKYKALKCIIVILIIIIKKLEKTNHT
jgi:hypothetical protein